MAVGPSGGIGINRFFQQALGRVLEGLNEAIRGPAAAKEVSRVRDAFQDGVEPSTGGLMVTLDKMFGRSNLVEGYVPPPAGAYFAAKSGVPRGFNPIGGLAGKPPQSQGAQVGRSIEAATRANPDFRSEMEQALGGRIIPGSTDDGRLLVWRNAPRAPNGLFIPVAGGLTSPAGISAAAKANGLPGAHPAAGTILDSLTQMEANIIRMAKAMNKDPEHALNSTTPGSDGSSEFPSGGGMMDLFQEQMKSTNELMDSNRAEAEKNRDDDDPDLPGAPPLGSGVVGGTPSPARVPWLQSQGQVQGQVAAGGAGFQRDPAAVAAAGAQAAGVQAAASNPAPGQKAPGPGDLDQSKMSDTMKQQMLQEQITRLRRYYEMLTTVLKSMHEMMKTAIDNIK